LHGSICFDRTKIQVKFLALFDHAMRHSLYIQYIILVRLPRKIWPWLTLDSTGIGGFSSCMPIVTKCTGMIICRWVAVEPFEGCTLCWCSLFPTIYNHCVCGFDPTRHEKHLSSVVLEQRVQSFPPRSVLQLLHCNEPYLPHPLSRQPEPEGCFRNQDEISRNKIFYQNNDMLQ
jgi:hypothetical protein